MLQYSKINDAWDIPKKEIFKKNVNEENTCESFEHVLNCEKCLEKLRKKLVFTENFSNNKKEDKEDKEHKEHKEDKEDKEDIKQPIIQEHFTNNIIQDHNIEDFSNSIINTKLLREKINNFMNRNKDFKQLILIVLIFLVAVLLIQSFRKPVEFDGLNKKIFIYPEELSKIKSLLK